MQTPPEQFDHPAWLTALGTAVSYGIVIAFLFVLLFVVPFGLFTLL